MIRRSSAVLVVGVLALAAHGRAQSGAALREALRVEPSADGCVSAATLEPRVRRWLHAGAQPSDITVTVHAASEPPSFSVARDGNVIAERRFDVLPAACSDRLDAIAVAVAVAIEHATSEQAGDGAAAGSAPGESRERDGTPLPRDAKPDDVAAEPEPVPAPPSDAVPEGDRERGEEDGADRNPADDEDRGEADASADTSSDGSALRLFAGAALLFEVLPSTAFAFQAGAELQPSALRFGAAALFSLEREDGIADGRALTRLIGARAHVCMGTRLANDDVDLEGCGGAAAGLVLASGDGFAPSADATLGWLAGVLRAAVRYPATAPISLRFALDGLLNVVRPELQVEVEIAGIPDAPPVTAAAGPIGAAGSVELVIELP